MMVVRKSPEDVKHSGAYFELNNVADNDRGNGEYDTCGVRIEEIGEARRVSLILFRMFAEIWQIGSYHTK